MRKFIMKPNDIYQTQAFIGRTVRGVCLDSCQRLLAHLEAARARILAEFRANLQGHERVLELAVNEAEALAWQTGFPQLLFPALAAEKARSVETWHRRQQRLYPHGSARTAAWPAAS
jgi:hypothetical protein